MRTKLAYGKTGWEINLPDARDVTVVEPIFVPGSGDPREGCSQRVGARSQRKRHTIPYVQTI